MSSLKHSQSIQAVLYKKFLSNFWMIVFVIVVTLGMVGLGALLPWPFKVLIDTVLAGEENAHIAYPVLGHVFDSRYTLGLFIVFVYFFSLFFNSILDYIRSMSMKRVIKKVTADFSKEAFRNIESLAIGYYGKQQIGDYIYRLGYDISALGELLEDGIVPLFTSILYLVVTIIVMLFIDVKLTLIALLFVPFLTLGLYFFNTRIKKATKASELTNSASFSFIEEALTHIRIIQAFSREKKEADAFDTNIDSALVSDYKVYSLNFILSLFVGVIIAISYSAIILYGIHNVFFGSLTTGLLIVFMFYLDNLTTPIQSIIFAITSLSESFVKLRRMEDFFNPETHMVHGGAQKFITDTHIKFQNVSISGEKGGRKILSKVSFDIEAGKFTVIFGLNGSGKTTILNLILRFIDKIDQGKIFLGGVDIKQYDLDSLRSSIAYVPQEISLFNDTIKNNIAFGQEGAKAHDVHTAAELAIADDFISKLPGGYDFTVGEGGTLLSGGQRQRVMLARALVKKNTQILLLDETFSALDVRSRTKVMKSIKKHAAGKTVVIVSNIFDVISVSDNVIVMNKGEVVYKGPSSHLNRESALYDMMVDAEL